MFLGPGTQLYLSLERPGHLKIYSKVYGNILEKYYLSKSETLAERHHHLVWHADAHLRHVTQTSSMRSDVEYSSNPTYVSWN